MIISTKLILTGAASLLGVALAAGGLLLGTGVLTAADDPGQVLQMSGVGPVSVTSGATTRPQATATTPTPTHAPTHAKTPAAPRVPVGQVAPRSTVGQVTPPAAQTLPSYRVVTPSPSAPAQPVAPQPAHHGPEPVHSSPGMHMEGH